MADPTASGTSSGSKGILDFIEWVGNKLPDPATLFLLGAAIVMVLSAVLAANKVEVQPQRPHPVLTAKLDSAGNPIVNAETGEPVMVNQIDPATNKPVVEWRAEGDVIKSNNLLTSDGLFWCFKTMVKNFIEFAPLGIVLTGMLGIGVAERTGLLGALMKAFMLIVPSWALTPAMVFVGIMSSMAMDAGYVVLPPLAAALYKAVGRSPLAGLAAVFAGVSAGFNANLLITGLDPLLSGLSTAAAQVVDPDYIVTPPCNWYFLIASTFLITLAGWGVTAFFVERRLKNKSVEEGGPAPATSADLESQRLTPTEVKGLIAGLSAIGVTVLAFILLAAIPGAPLHGIGDRFDRWIETIVPMIFLGFLIPGMTYGLTVGTIRSDKDAAKMLIDSMASMAPIIVLAFFAGQFIAYFNHSNIGRMLAETGGAALGRMDMAPWMLMVVFVVVVMFFNLFVGSMSAKYTMFAPIFVPMFMLVGISPELTQAAYRIGDSVTNVITPLNAYLVIILVFMKEYVPKGGMGTLIAAMVPYTVVFTVVWVLMLIFWMQLGLPLGPDAGLWYDVTQGAAAAVGG